MKASLPSNPFRFTVVNDATPVRSLTVKVSSPPMPFTINVSTVPMSRLNRPTFVRSKSSRAPFADDQ